mmetsp:Transcript_21583/g.50804  ORF Transcript_21583/g.50804 Transcript_21583/m.50804 type:complete len:336 (+) Transcript_21583:3-1010(+)
MVEAMTNRLKQHLEQAGWPAAGARVWQEVPNASVKCEEVSVVQFNILAHGLSCKESDWGGFDQVPTDWLDFDVRKQRLLEHILDTNGDIVCLEECDHFSDWFAPQLEECGYTGTFLKKVQSPCLRYIPTLEDGCAIFWKRDKWEATRVLEHNYQGQNQMLLAVEFVSKTSDSRLVVASTHLAAAKTAEGASQREGQVLELVAVLNKEFPKTTPIVLCGDFNASPKEAAFSAAVTSCLDLCSAYGARRAGVLPGEAAAAEPPYTTWKLRGDKESRHTIDYIFYTPERLIECTRVLQLPGEADIPPPRLPSQRFASDHLLLAATFALQGPSSSSSRM